MTIKHIQKRTGQVVPFDAEKITDAIRRLPPGYRAVFNLFAIEGKSHKEIAEMLNIRPDTSASQFYKARNLLAGMLKDLNRQGHEV